MSDIMNKVSAIRKRHESDLEALKHTCNEMEKNLKDHKFAVAQLTNENERLGKENEQLLERLQRIGRSS